MRTNVSRIRPLALSRVLPLLAVMIEVLWVYPLALWVSTWTQTPWSSPPLSLGSVVMIIVASEAVSRSFGSRMSQPNLARLVVLGMLLLVVAVVIRLDVSGGYVFWNPAWGSYARQNIPALLFALGLAAYLLWRGITIAQDYIQFQTLYGRFVFGIVAMSLLLMIWGAQGRMAQDPAGLRLMVPYVAGYFGLGIFSLGLANIMTLRDSVRGPDASLGLFTRRWVFLLLIVVVTIVATALGMAAVFSFDLANALLHYLGVFGHWIFTAFIYAIGIPMGVLAAGLIYVFQFLTRFLTRRETPFEPPGAGDIVSGLQEAAEGNAAWVLTSEAILAIKWSLVALVVLAVILLLARTLSKHLDRGEDSDIEEISESLWAWDSVRAELMSWLVGLWKLFRRRTSTEESKRRPSPPIAATMSGEDDHLLTIREIYRGLLWEGGHIGLPRHQSETPYEYQVKLGDRIDENTALASITDSYVAARYGEGDTPERVLRRLNRLWLRLRDRLRATGDRVPHRGGK